MKTAIHGGAIRNLSAKGYAGGGLIDALQRITGIGESPEKKAYRAQAAAERAAEAEAKKSPKPPAPDNALGNYVANTALKQREQAAGLKNGGAIKGPIGAMRAKAMHPDVEIKAEDKGEPKNAERMEMRGMKFGAIKKYANGGMAQKKSVEGAKLKGPGTPTSDSIPATVVDTGEPIKVATGERIVSGSQGQALTQEAKTQGYKSLDDKLQSMTGKPVGPTIQYQKGAIRKMANGGELDKFNNDLAQAQALAAARASGASLTPAVESANQQSYLASMDSARNMEPSTPYLKQEKTGAIRSAADSLRGIYGTPTPQPAPTPTVTRPAAVGAPQPLASTPATNIPVSIGALPTAPTASNAPTGQDVGYGVKRFNTDGKSPLFTNVSESTNAPSGDWSKTAQYAQGVEVGRKDIAAADAIDARNKESSDIQQAAARAVLETRGGKRSTESIRAEQARMALDQNGRIESARSKASEASSGAIQKLARDRFALDQNRDSRESAVSGMDQKARQQLMDAQQEYLNAGDDPVKRKAAELKLMTLGGKQGKAPTFHPGSRIKNVDGSETVTPAYVFDPATMEAREVQPGGQPALPPGMVKQVGTANGKPVYLDKNGNQVIAKG